MSRVAKEVGVSAPALYWYFDSKVDLAFSFMKGALEDLKEFLESEITADTPLGQLTQYVRSYVVYELETADGSLPAQDTLQRHGFQQLLDSLPEVDHRHLKSLERWPYERLCRILEAGVAAEVFHFEDRAVTAQAILCMCDYVFTWYRPEGRFSKHTVAEIFAAIAVRMVQVPGAVGCASLQDSEARRLVVPSGGNEDSGEVASE